MTASTTARLRWRLQALAAACVWVAATALPATAADEPAYVHVAVPGDTLIGLGRRFLVDPARWPELARENRLRNPDRIGVGAALRIPLRLMRVEPLPARVLGVVGTAQAGGAALQAGQPVPEGGEISTGDDGHVTVRLVDGTVLRLRPDSRLQVRTSDRIPAADLLRSGVRLQQGRVEVQAAPAPAGRPGFRIESPQGVLGVRGTEFRVAADGAKEETRGEVLVGAVGFQGRPGAAAEPVPAGYGSVIGAGGDVLAPVPLLGAVDTSTLPPLHERLLLRLALPPLPGAAAYRGLVARDAGFENVLADLTSATPELRFAGLPDGDYVLRVRAIDARGLEGQDSDLRFRLKAHPEAPLPTAPAPRQVGFGDRIDFAWSASVEADSYRLRLGATPDFAPPLREFEGLRATALTVEGLAPGTYHWQLASVRADGDRGPWGEVGRFELRPLPPTPPPPKIGDRSLSFAWEGRPGQTFEFQVARDAGFTQLVFERTLAQPALELPLPGTGRFYVRLRARDPDGFMGPYTTPQFVDIPNCVRAGGACVRAGEGTLNLAQ